MKTRNLRLLIVEDNFDDQQLMRRALKRMDENIEVEAVCDGEEAIERLCGVGSECPLPDLTILDWKLPKRMGADVLKAVRHDGRRNGLIVVAFSSSDDPDDHHECLALGGNDFVVKPVVYESFLLAVQRIVAKHCPEFLDGADPAAVGRLAHFYTTDSAAAS